MAAGGRATGVEAPPRVGVLAVAADETIRRQIEQYLGDAGAEVVAISSGQLDGLVALISPASVADDDWRALATDTAADRIAPVRLGAVPASALPTRLRPLSWIEWTDHGGASALGTILGALLADPARRQLSRQLRHEADAWHAAGCPDSELISDHRRVRRLLDQLEQLEVDPLAAPDELTVTFVKASAEAARRKRRRQVPLRIGAGLLALACIAMLIVELPRINRQALANRAAIVTLRDPAVLDAAPSWAAVNAGALLLEGTPEQQELGRSTLGSSFNVPWPLGATTLVDSIRALAPLSHGRLALALAFGADGSGLALLDVEHGAIRATWRLGRLLSELDVSRDGETAVAAGDGAVVIDRRAGSITTIAREGRYDRVRLLRDGSVLLASEDDDVLLVDRDGRRRATARYREVRDLGLDPAGAPLALVELADGRQAIVDAADGTVRAAARIPDAQAVGALAPDGRRAVLEGAGDQLWTFADAGPPRRTGIAVPTSVNDLAWASGDRLVMASEERRAEVIYLPRAIPLGTVCRDVPRTARVQLAYDDDDVVSCRGEGMTATWKIPSGPLRGPRLATVSTTAVTTPEAIIETRGAQLRVRLRGRLGSLTTGWTSRVGSTITAAAADQTGRRIVVGAQGGTVVIIELAPRVARIVSAWDVPNGATVTAVGWHHGPIVATTAGQQWRVPDCRGCVDDEGLLRTLRERLAGCFIERQILWISAAVRRRIGLRQCPPVHRF